MAKKTKHKILKKACGKGGALKEYGKGFLSGVSNGASESPVIGQKILDVADKVKNAGSTVKNKMQEGYKKLRDATPEQIGKGVGTAVRGAGKIATPAVLGAGAILKSGIDSTKKATPATPAQPKGQTGTTTVKAAPAIPAVPKRPTSVPLNLGDKVKPLPPRPSQMPSSPSKESLIEKMRERRRKAIPDRGIMKRM